MAYIFPVQNVGRELFYWELRNVFLKLIIMKTRLLGLALLGLTLCTPAKAIQKQIVLRCTDNKDVWVQDNRSLSLLPTAVHDGNVITICSEKTLEEVCIYVVDAHGSVLHTEEVGTLSGEYSFTLSGEPKGTLWLVVQTDEESYEGTFSL